MRIFINAAHTPHSPGAVYGGRNEHADVLSFSEELRKRLVKAEAQCSLFIGYDKPQNITSEDMVLIFHRGVSYKNAVADGASVTVPDSSDADIQYEAFRILDAVCRSGGYRYRGVHTATDKFPHRFITKTGTSHTFLFDMGFIENSRDNRIFDETKEKTAQAAADMLIEIYKEGNNENFS